MINYVKANNAIMDAVQRFDLDCRQQSVMTGLFHIFNEERFPKGRIRISNKRLISHTGLRGSRADRALREIRQQLADLGLIEFTPGDGHREDPSYRIRWEALGVRDNEDDVGAKDAAHVASKNGPDPYNNISPYQRDIKPKTGERKRTPAAKPMPTAEEIRAYAEQIGLEVNPLRFIDWHAARGIRLDDWRAALRTWKYRESDAGPGRTVSAQRYRQRNYTEAELEARIAKI